MPYPVRFYSSSAILAAAGVAVFVTACDPCAGVSSCADRPVISYVGEVVDPDGRPVPGAEVTFEWQEGVELLEDVFGGSTDELGRFRIDQPASGSGMVVLDVTVRASETDMYRGTGLSLATVRAGDTRFMGSLRNRPYVSSLVEVLLRGSGRPLAGATIDFVPTAGVQVHRQPDPVVTDPAGRAWIEMETTASGELIGDLTVAPAEREQALALQGVRLSTFFRPGQSRFIRAMVGPSLAYGGRILAPGAQAGAADVLVAFQRTGGLELAEDSLEVVTDQNGVFPLFLAALDPYAEGEVTGRLHIHVPGSFQPIQTTDVRVTTFHEDGVRLLQEWVLAPA